jgi:hypothetical protein
MIPDDRHRFMPGFYQRAQIRGAVRAQAGWLAPVGGENHRRGAHFVLCSKQRGQRRPIDIDEGDLDHLLHALAAPCLAEDCF